MLPQQVKKRSNLVNTRTIILEQAWSERQTQEGYNNLKKSGYSKVLNKCLNPNHQMVQGNTFYNGPGVYVIFCTKNNYMYFGESENVTFRVGMHMNELKLNQSRITPLQHDWNKYGGPRSFRFLLLCAGPTWYNAQSRRVKEREFINLCPERCYNLKFNPAKVKNNLLQQKALAPQPTVTPVTNTNTNNIISSPFIKKQPEKDLTKINPPQPITINGKTFPSLTQAAAANNISRGTLQYRLNQGLELIKPSSVTQIQTSSSQTVTPNSVKQNQKVTLQPSDYKIVFRGVLYNSTTEATALTGVHRSTVYRALKDENVTDTYYSDLTGNKLESNPVRKQKFLIEGKTYASIGEAITATGLLRDVIYRRCSSDNLYYPNWSTFVE
uniref:Putative GIY-YIG homing endonuclease n=1 Tax=Phacotus lenticularis TaxID=52965 RepID=A0A0S2LQG8_9CHLO|nr:putative GIY-YIG homing endonuclease [Phacotus lenticularis]ALO63636.1 putative GIY-YIG homing endonuclease [Phacotus lenticularis]